MVGDTAEITVRVAGRADAQAVYDLVVELGRARGLMDKVTSTVEDIERDGFGENPAFEALLAEIDGKPAGLCLFFGSYSTWRGQRGLYVQDLIVADAARSLGVGQRLLAEAAALARSRGAGYLRLSVDDDNVGAQRFYRRMGLKHSTSELIYVLDDNDFIALANAAKEMAGGPGA